MPEKLEDGLASRAGRLFAAYRDGDEAVMADLVRTLTPILWHTVRAIRLDTAAAEDVLQTVWLTLVRKADTISEPQAVLQWMIVTTRREAWRVAKAASRVRPEDFDSAVGQDQTPSGESVEDDVVAADSQSRLWQHIQTLPQRCQALLRVIAFADRPDYAELARSLGMPQGSIGPTRGRCLAKLRLVLAADPAWGGTMNTYDHHVPGRDGDDLTADDRELALAAEPLNEADYALLDSLQALYDETDPVPDGLVERIQFEITLDALHAELATLTQLDLAGSGARSASTESVRTITFTAETVTTMVTISPQDDGSVRVDGWVAPGAGLLVEVLLADGARRTHADDDGRFVVEGLPAGLAKFALHTTDAAGSPHTVVSPTIEL